MVADFILLILVLILLIITLLIFLMMPRFSKRKAMRELFQFDYCHRGFHDDEIPENCLKGFIKASQYGYGMELDVQCTKDNQLIVLHDFNLLRACGQDLDVSQVPYNEIQQFSLFNTQEKIPLFSDVLKAIDGKTPLIVEIKQKGIDCTSCIKAAAQLDHYQGAFCVESFNPVAVGWFKKHRPHYLRGQLSKDFVENSEMSSFMKFVSKNLLLNFLSRPDFIAYKIQSTNTLSVKIMKQLRVPLVIWTVQEIETYHEMKNKVDMIIFENFNPSVEQ